MISRKAITNEISYKFGLGDSIISNAVRIIKDHPTAYDVDKVIQQLEENKADAIKTIRKVCESYLVPEQAGNLVELLEVYTREQIEIVKKGGV